MTPVKPIMLTASVMSSSSIVKPPWSARLRLGISASRLQHSGRGVVDSAQAIVSPGVVGIQALLRVTKAVLLRPRDGGARGHLDFHDHFRHPGTEAVRPDHHARVAIFGRVRGEPAIV